MTGIVDNSLCEALIQESNNRVEVMKRVKVVVFMVVVIVMAVLAVRGRESSCIHGRSHSHGRNSSNHSSNIGSGHGDTEKVAFATVVVVTTVLLSLLL